MMALALLMTQAVPPRNLRLPHLPRRATAGSASETCECAARQNALQVDSTEWKETSTTAEGRRGATRGPT